MRADPFGHIKEEFLLPDIYAELKRSFYGVSCVPKHNLMAAIRLQPFVQIQLSSQVDAWVK